MLLMGGFLLGRVDAGNFWEVLGFLVTQHFGVLLSEVAMVLAVIVTCLRAFE